MAITNPHIIATPIVSATGSLTSASQIQAADDNSVETRLTTLDSLVSQAASVGIQWNYNSGTASDPATETFRFNNADPTQATILYLDVESKTGNFTEFITQFATGGFIYLQDTTNPGNSYLYATSGTVTLQGGSTGYFSVPVAFRQSKGSLNAANDDAFDFTFIPVSAAGGSLPNRFLSELEEVDRNVFTRKVDTEAVVRFWLRSAIVTTVNVDDSGTGLRIDEANGSSAEPDTFVQTTNANNVYVYVTLDDTFADGTDLNTLYLIIKDPDGNITDEVNFGTNFILQSDIDGVVAGRPYRSISGLNGGAFLHYVNNSTLELFFVDTERFFDLPVSNENNVDLTRSVKDLPESRLSSDVQAKLNYQHGIPDDDQFKLDQLVEVSTTTTPAALTGSDTVYYKRGAFSADATDYFTTDFDTGLPPSLDTSTTWTVVVPHNRTITSITGLESGTGTVTLIKDDILLNGVTGTYKIYQAVVPSTSSGTNFFVFFGTQTTITEIDPSDLIKIDRNNVQADFLTHIENTNGTTSETARIAALETKVSTLYPLAPDVDALTNWGDIYIPERAQQEVVITQGYDLIADYRGDSTRYESAGVTYSSAGTNVITYSGLSNSLQRLFGFKVNAPADQVLMWIVDGSDRIPLVDMTVGGNYRVNNYTQATTASQPTTETGSLALVSGDTRTIEVNGSNARFIIPDYPAGATVTSRSTQADFDVLVNGVDTGAGHFETFDIPETQVAQDRIQRTFNIYLGPLHGNRSVSVTIDYRFVVAAGPEYRLIFTLQSAPSDVTISVRDVIQTRTYTPAATTTRTDNFVTLQDAGGDYTFTGENELLLSFDPQPQGSTMEVVPAAVDSTGDIDELNDRVVPVPAHGFDSVECPDATTLTNFEFRTARVDHYLRHSDLSTLLADRATQWMYGLARLRTISTTHAVSEIIDLASGSTIGGAAITRLAPNAVYEAQNTTTGQDGLVNQVTLPANYTTYDHLHISERDAGPPVEWRHAVISVDLLSSGLVGSSDNIRLQGNTDLTWDSTTRELTLAGGAQEIARVELFSVS